MEKTGKNEEIKALKKALKQEQRKNVALEKKYDALNQQYKILKCDNKKKARKLLISSLSEKERQLVEMLFPDTDTKK